VGTGSITACKAYDRNGNGLADPGEPYVPGWKMELSGTLANGAVYGPVDQFTGDTGCTTFSPLMPGTYTLIEIFPSGNWFTKDGAPQTFTIESKLVNGIPTGDTYTYAFANYCKCYANFDTKGYWHNKNGLSELYNDPNFSVLLAYINSLDPYNDPSGYFDNGEEPFDGYDEFGNPVPPAIDSFGDYGYLYNEISQFLVDPNAGGGGGDQEQLAQQLLAFIFNANYRLGNLNTVIEVNGQWMSAQSVIDEAVKAWTSPTTDDDKYWEPILDGLNNNDMVPVINYNPCPVVYP
jgi:hypothetical protein